MKKLLALNRGEIAIRIFRAANELKIRTVAVYSHEDRLSLHRFKADEAYLIGEGKGPVQAYLDVDGIVALAREKGVDAIHPGLRFSFGKSRASARLRARGNHFHRAAAPNCWSCWAIKQPRAGWRKRRAFPWCPGPKKPVTDPDEAQKIAHEIGFPLIIKAAFGGGGRGMRVVR